MSETAHTASEVVIADLVRQMQQNDKVAMARFYSLYYDRIYRFLITSEFLGGLNTNHIEDLCQSIILHIFQKIDKYRDQENGSFDGWVTTVAGNYARNYLRDNRFGVEVNQDMLSPVVENLWADPLTPEGALLMNERSAVMTEVFNWMRNNLNEEESTIIRLRLEGHTFPDIAETLGKSLAAVKAQFYRIRNKFKDPKVVAGIAYLFGPVEG